MEIWKTLRGCSKYECSNLGRFRSKPRLIKDKNGNILPFKRPNLIMTQRKASDGYRVTLETDIGIRKAFRIEILIAEAFLGKRKEHYVYHKKNNAYNNNVNNLKVETLFRRYGMTKRNSRIIIGYPNYILKKDGIVVNIKNGKQIANVYAKANKCWAVRLWKNNKTQLLNLYRLLAIHFMPNPSGLPEVHHKDYDRLNHSLNNLKWVTASENMRDAFKNGKTKGCFEKGSKHLKCKITKEDILEIRKLRKKGKTLKEIGELYDISGHRVSDVCRKKQNIEYE